MSKTYSSILKSAIMPVADRVMNTKLIYYYKETKRMQRWSNCDITEWQNKKLQNLILYAYENTAYYYELFNKNNIDYRNIKNKDDLYKVPILTKEIIRDKYNELRSQNNTRKFVETSTGGSTGKPLKYLMDLDSWSMSNALNIINWEKTDYKYGDKFIALGSTSLFVDKKASLKHKIYYRLKRKIGLNGINLSDQICKSYLEYIKSKNIRFIYGYASAVYLLAKYSLENHIDINIKACFPTSEVLTDLYKKTIYDAFGCKIVNCYGAHDGGIVAFEHMDGFFETGYNTIVILESINSNNTGAALLTDLYNFAMPLINYKVGDHLEIDKNKNKDYSYNGQVINSILGRSSDIIKLANGNILTGPGFTILFKDLPVKAYRIRQTKPDEITCEIIIADNFNRKHESLILTTLQKQAGSGISVFVEYFDEFNFNESGKRDYFISE